MINFGFGGGYGGGGGAPAQGGGGGWGGGGGGMNPWLQGLAQRIQAARAQFGGQMGQQFGFGGGWNPHAGGMGGEGAPAQGQGQRPMAPAWGGPQAGGGMLPGGWSRGINGFGGAAPAPQGPPITTAGQQQSFAAPQQGARPQQSGGRQTDNADEEKQER